MQVWSGISAALFHYFKAEKDNLHIHKFMDTNRINLASLSHSDAEVFMVRATDTVGEGDGSIDVCLDPGVGGMMERTLTVLLNFTNGTAS